MNKPRRRRGKVTLEAPQHLDWYLWRVLTSSVVKVTLTELKTTWTLLDLADAHDALDLMEQLEEKAHKAAQEQAQRERG